MAEEMKELSKEELLQRLDDFYLDYRGDLRPGDKWKPKQAYQQIRKLVEYYFDEGIQQIVSDLKKTEEDRADLWEKDIYD